MALKEINDEKHMKLAFAVCVLGVYLFYLLGNLNIYLYQSLTKTWYAAFLPILFAGTLYFWRHWDKWEYRLLVIYYLSFILTRVLNHDAALAEDYYSALYLTAMVPMLALGLTLNSGERERFLNIFSCIVGAYYALLGMLGIYAFIHRIQIINPITQQHICGIRKTEGFARLSFMDINSDVTAFWFMSAFLLMLYQMFACKRKGMRLLVALGLAVDYIVLAMIYIRSILLAVSLIVGLLAVLLLYEYIKIQKNGMLACILTVAFIISVPVVYSSFNVIRQGFGRVSTEVRYIEATEEEKKEAYIRDYTNPKKIVGNSVDQVTSGRMGLYLATMERIRRNPQILLKGCLEKDITEDTLIILHERGQFSKAERLAHHHNYLIEVLVLTGLVGFLPVIAFSLLLAVRVIKFFFDKERAITIGKKILVFPIVASLLYGLAMACFFTTTDLRTLFFFLMSGMFLGWYYEYFPKRERECK